MIGPWIFRGFGWARAKWLPGAVDATAVLAQCDPGLQLAPEWRDTYEQFATPDHSVERLSLTRRPDAISFDYLQAFTAGPYQIGDPRSGAFDRPWYAREAGGTVMIARANDDNTAWEAEQVWFTYTGPLIEEIDIAFDQNGNAVVVGERATGLNGTSEVWQYWYDPTVPGYVLANRGEGRNPRILLDNPLDTEESDVLVFYLQDSVDAIVYRTQRDRYQAVASTPVLGIQNVYLEEVVKQEDSRIYLVVSRHNPDTARYDQDKSLKSHLYPKRVTEQGLELSHEVVFGHLRTMVYEIWFAAEDTSVDTRLQVLEVTLDPVIWETAAGGSDGGVQPVMAFTYGEVKEVIKVYASPSGNPPHPDEAALFQTETGDTLEKNESVTTLHEVLYGYLDFLVINHVHWPDDMTTKHEVLSVELQVA